MHIAVVHDRILETDGPDAKDVLDQANAVETALTARGHTVFRVSCDLNLAAVCDAVRLKKADQVFNLVESIGGKGQLIHLFPFALDALPLSYTGAPAEAMVLTSGKLLAKTWMQAADIPTPFWIDPRAGKHPLINGHEPEAKQDWIVKSVWEHASMGMGPDSLVRNITSDAMRKKLAAIPPSPGGPLFAEVFIAGREFNVSLLAGPDDSYDPVVLPPAEIVFDGYTDDMPRIVDYKAKWDPSAFEYHHTRRTFRFAASDQKLLERLKAISLTCWHHFGLAGYARVDFRVDGRGNPFVLEINANPCLSPDAGFAAALEAAGISFEDAVARIVEDVQ